MKWKVTLKGAARRLRKTFFVFALVFTVITGTVILCISPIAKYLIETYDEKYTGRQIKVESVYINPLTGYILLSNPRIYELKSDRLALVAAGISANLSLSKLFSKTFDIGELVLDHPKWIIAQNGSKRDLNFKDLIEKFSSNKTSDPSKSPTKFYISSLKIKEGKFYYLENVTPINYSIKDVNISSSRIGWGADTIAFNYSFLSGIKTGSMKGVFTINVKNLDYRLRADIVKYDLQIMEQYLKGLSNYGSFRANLDAKIRSKGSLINARDLKFKGYVCINDMHFGKDSIEDFAGFKKLAVGITALYPGNNKYIFDTIALSEPFFKYERYDHLDNFQTIFGKGGSKVSAISGNSERFNLILEIASYVEKLAKNFFRSYYKVNRIEISKANFKYEDYTLSEKFAIATDPLFIEADSIDKNREEVKVKLHTNLKPYGQISINLSVDPRDSSNFDMQYRLDKLPLAMFNPYLITYTSFPMNRGTMEVRGSWRVRDGKINSTNHLIVVDPRIAGRIKNKNAKWIPLRLIMAMVRERGNVIDYEIPISGNLKKPKLHLKDAIIDLLENIVVNPATTPYRLEVRKTEEEIEKSLSLQWETGQTILNKHQRKFVEEVASFLEENPKASVSVYPMQYSEKEKEHILFYEAKKKYYLTKNGTKATSFSEKDSLYISKMSVRDSFFIKHLNKCCGKGLVYTIQEKCTIYVGQNLVNKKFENLQKQRRTAFKECFAEGTTKNQLKIVADKKVIPYNGFSFYKIKYNGELPDYLVKAYEKMNNFNSKAPREKYKGKRRKNK